MALRPRRAFLTSWLILLLLKVWLACSLPIFSDEAWYWLEGRQPAWAYSDLPGLTAWLARLGTMVGGDSLIGLRWPFLLLGAATPWLGVRIARRWLGEEAGWRAGICVLLLPLASTAGLLALPDVPLMFATLLTFDACLGLLEGVTAAACVQLAIGLAMGATSHYRFLIALAGGAVGLLASREGRALLRNGRVLAALACGAVAWLPVALFNFDEHAAALRFQFVDRHPWRFHLHGLELQMAQPLLTGPLLYAGIAWVLWQAWKRRHDSRWMLLLGAAGLPLALFVGLAPFVDIQRVSFHWPLSAYLLALVALPWLLREGGHPRWSAWIVASNGLLCVALWSFATLLVVPGGDAWLERIGFRPKMFVADDAATDAARQRLLAMPADTVAVADDFMLAAKLEFALAGSRRVISLDHRLDAKHGRAVQLAIWGRDESAVPALAGRPVLLVVDEEALHPEAREPWSRHLCALFPGMTDAGEVALDEGRQHFLFYRRDPGATGRCAYPSFAFLRSPLPDARVSGALEVAGWASQDGVGVARVEVLLDGRSVALARYGIEDVEVRSQWPGSDDPRQPDVGFDAHPDLTGIVPGWHELALRVTGNDGRVRVLENRTIRVSR
ncbi:MAG TPA: glycosyltransferase family 39 protein [Xanthomonadaceae bacterium]|jgi:hypothetical protein